MDGFAASAFRAVPGPYEPALHVPVFAPRFQNTLKAAIGCTGIGLHGGQPACLTLVPAAPGTGIVFTRTDLPGIAPGHADGPPLAARHDMVVDTRLCTTIGVGAVRIGTIEHLLAACAGLGIDNLLVRIDGPEVPILDGSADPFLFLIDCAGVVAQDVPCARLEVLRPVRVTRGEDFAELLPTGAAGAPGFDLQVSIEFAARAIGSQSLALRLTPDGFRRELAGARTFAQQAEIADLQQAGLARGGSLANAVVVDGARVLNPGGLRRADEFVRHKMLDAVGDLALAGACIVGRFVAHRTGHALNNRLLHALFADPTAWRLHAPSAALRSAA